MGGGGGGAGGGGQQKVVDIGPDCTGQKWEQQKDFD